jgi:xanthine dehydrogenase small subunit
MKADNTTDSAQLVLNGQVRALPFFDPNTSLLAYLRDSVGLAGTKEGCASGDCGACTVIVTAADGSAPQTVNSCITPLGFALGKQVVTVEGVGTPAQLHPVQAAMVAEHGSQCGFCTPGFVMSLVGAQLQGEPGRLASRERADRVRAISGNLCRCTGYRPILDAALAADQAVDAAPARAQPAALTAAALASPGGDVPGYKRPETEQALQACLRDGGTLIAGTTDFWLEVSQRYQDFERLIDLTGIASLRRIERTEDGLRIGAGVSHEQLVSFFAGGEAACPSLVTMLHRFGSPQIRGRGTLGGNLAGGSPIADWSPTLLAVSAVIILRSAQGAERRLPLDDFFLGYRQTARAADEYIAAVEIPATVSWPAVQVFKISKREDDDISSVLGAFALPVVDGALRDVRIAFGGVAATPVRLADVETLLEGQALTPALIDRACEQVGNSIAPISDVRASAAYRQQVAANLLRKALLLSQGAGPLTLDAVLAGGVAP